KAHMLLLVGEPTPVVGPLSTRRMNLDLNPEVLEQVLPESLQQRSHTNWRLTRPNWLRDLSLFRLPLLRDQEAAVTGRRQPSRSEEIARFDHKHRRLLDPVGNASVDLAEQRDVILSGGERKAVDAAPEPSHGGSRRKIDSDHFVVQDHHALTALREQVN